MLTLSPRFSPGVINCFNSADEFAELWNGTLVYPQIDIKTGFTDPVDLQYFNSQVSVMDERWKAFGEVCLKHETGQYLPYVGTTATVRDMVALAEYFDGKGCDINYYGLSYGTTIGNYLINSALSFSPTPTQLFTPFLQCSPPVLAGSSWTAWRTPPLTLPSPLISTGLIVSSPSMRPTRASLRDAPSPVPMDVLLPLILLPDRASSNGPRTSSVYVHLHHRLKPLSHLRQVAHDYARSSGNDKYKSVFLVGAIHGILYTPDQWADFAAGPFYEFYQDLVQASDSNLTLASRSLWAPPELKRQSGQSWPDYTFQAISCGDSIDESDITTQAVFDELARVVKDVSPMCEWTIFPSFPFASFLPPVSSWRSVPPT